MTETPPLRCFMCEKRLTPVGEGIAQPYDGLVFTAGGNFGSAVFDPGGARGRNRLLVVICDKCVTEHLGRVLVQTITRVQDTVTYTQPSSLQELP